MICDEKKEKGILAAVLWLLALVIFLPLYFVVINSFKTKQESSLLEIGLPKVWNIIENYTDMFRQAKVGTAFVNSIIVSVSSVALIILCASLMGFVLQRRKTKFTGVLKVFVIMGIILPVQIIPTFFITQKLQMEKILAYILIMTATSLPYSVFLYMGYFRSISRELDEAACIDGTGALYTFFKIIFPLAKPITVTVLILNFMSVWNEFGVALYYLNDHEHFTLPLTIYSFFGRYSSEWNLVFSNVIVCTLPVLVLYLILQKHIIDGMTAGAVKS